MYLSDTFETVSLKSVLETNPSQKSSAILLILLEVIMIVGYIRASTADQNPARQEEAFKNHGVERVFEEKISGKDMNRPKLRELLDLTL